MHIPYIPDFFCFHRLFFQEKLNLLKGCVKNGLFQTKRYRKLNNYMDSEHVELIVLLNVILLVLTFAHLIKGFQWDARKILLFTKPFMKSKISRK